MVKHNKQFLRHGKAASPPFTQGGLFTYHKFVSNLLSIFCIPLFCITKFLYGNTLVSHTGFEHISPVWLRKKGNAMYKNKVEICGVDTAKLKTLTDAEKRVLLEKAKAGDEGAREELIYGNLRLVLSIIQRFSGRRENADDLFQVGCIGLVKAVDNFNLTLDVKFSTYAVPMIIGEIRRYLRDNNSIRISRSVRDLAYRALQAREELTRERECEPTPEQIAEKLGVERAAVVQALEAIVEPISLYEPVYNEGGDSIYVLDQLSDTSAADEHWLENIALRDAMSRLAERERKIIELRFYKNKTQMEIADSIGISQAQVSRLEKGAIEKIRRFF